MTSAAETWWVVLGPFCCGEDARNVAEVETEGNGTVLSSEDLPDDLVRWLAQGEHTA